jgi:hypothetical protein
MAPLQYLAADVHPCNAGVNRYVEVIGDHICASHVRMRTIPLKHSSSSATTGVDLP